MLRFDSFVVAAAAALTVACGGGDPTISELGTEIGEIQCAKLFDCCTEAEIMEEFNGLSPSIETEAECRNFYAGLFQAFFVTSTQQAIDKGRLIYHADRAGACMDELRAMSCEEFAAAQAGDAPFDGCENPFEPLVEVGDACAQDMECKSDYCEGATNDQEGTCAERPGDGEECPDFECADGYFCEFGGANGPTCAAVKADGMDCTSDDECASGTCEDDGSGSGGGMCATEMTCDGQ